MSYRTVIFTYLLTLQAAERAQNAVLCPWWPWPLTFNFDLQTRPSEGPNTSSVWIWRKSVQRFLRYFIPNKNPQTDGAKNRTFRSSLRAVGLKIFNIRKVSNENKIFRPDLCSVSKTGFTIKCWQKLASNMAISPSIYTSNLTEPNPRKVLILRPETQPIVQICTLQQLTSDN